MNEQTNEEMNEIEQQIASNGGQTKQNYQAQVIKKVKKEKNKTQRKNMKNNAQILTEEEKAVNKLMVVSSNKEDSLSRQIIQDFNEDSNELQVVDLSHSSLKDSNTSCGWDDGFHVNYHFCDLKHFCSQIQSLDDLDKMNQKNQNQKESGNQNKNQKDANKQNIFDNCMNKMRYAPYFQFNKQEIEWQERCRTIYHKQYQQIIHNDQVCQCKDFQQQQNNFQIGLVEKSISAVKSVYFQKASQFQFSSNKKIVKMLRKQSQNITYQTQQQQKQDNDQASVRTIRAAINREIVQLKEIYKNKKSINISSDDEILKQKYNDNKKQFYSNSSERQNLRSQYKAILDYYSIPSPKLSQIKFNPNQLKTNNSNCTALGQKIQIFMDNQSQQQISLNHNDADNNSYSNKTNNYSPPNFQDSNVVQEHLFRTIQSISPSSQKNQNESHLIQRLAPLDISGEERKFQINKQNKNIDQKLYQTSPLSKHCSSPFNRQDQQEHHPKIYQKSFKPIKKIFFKNPDSAISYGSESTLEYSRQQEVAAKQYNSSNTSNQETNLPKLNNNYQAQQQQDNKIDSEYKNQISQKNLNQLINKHKLENKNIRMNLNDAKVTLQDSPFDQKEVEKELCKIQNKGFFKKILNDHNQGKCNDLHDSNNNIFNREKYIDENKHESQNLLINNKLNQLSVNQQNGKNQQQLQYILEQQHEQHLKNKMRCFEVNKQDAEQKRYADQQKNEKYQLNEDSQIKSNYNINQLINQREQILINQKFLQVNQSNQSGNKREGESTKDTIKVNQKSFQNINDFSQINNYSPNHVQHLQVSISNTQRSSEEQHYLKIKNKEEIVNQSENKQKIIQQNNQNQMKQYQLKKKSEEIKFVSSLKKCYPFPKDLFSQ
ncbi:hypothetical protein ABPG72_016831 [Tetrahymena utriculariae]